MCYLPVQEARDLKSWCQQDHVSTETYRGLLPCLFLVSGYTGIFSTLRLVHISLQFCLHVAFFVGISSLSLPSVYVCVSVQIPHFYKDISRTELEPTLRTSS